MRKNHNKHARRPADSCYGWDVIYADLPQIRGVWRLEVAPLKTIYYNCAVDEYTHTVRRFDDVDMLNRFCDKHGIKLW